ncbi:MAG: exodeoxyribonuclease VII small subunit [Desulfobacteraceae bacterium]|jgi:exodeoxyribonuclease VII small subunit
MAEKKFEEAMERLEEIVESLESGDLSLEESLRIFEEGMKLIGFCSKKLEQAEQKVSILIKDSGGKFAQQPFEMDEKEES